MKEKNTPGENTLPPVPGPIPGPCQPEQDWRIRQIEEKIRAIERHLSSHNFTPGNIMGPIYYQPVGDKK